MSPNPVLHLLPWMRRGIGRHLPRGQESVTVSLAVGGAPRSRRVSVHGPESVIGIPDDQVVRFEPVNGTKDFTANFFPFIELRTPDLPWMFSPQGPDRKGRLTPWIALAVVPERDGIHLERREGTRLKVLSIDRNAGWELPDPTDSWAWAHVQADIDPSAGIGDAFNSTPEAFRARLMCPRRLTANASYLACLVPIFNTGIAAGLGRPIPAGAPAPGWSKRTEGPIELPVYHSWRFQTGPEGDFEALVRRLRPAELQGTVGVAALDIGDPGGGLPSVPDIHVDYRAPLVSPANLSTRWDKKHRDAFQSDLAASLNAGLGDVHRQHSEPYDASRDDPVAAPPCYGSGVVKRKRLDLRRRQPAWLHDINLDPALRTAAGLGAKAVRRNQESLMAEAWDAAGAVADANAELAKTVLAEEVGTRLKKAKFEPLPDEALLRVTNPSHDGLRRSKVSVAERLDGSGLAGGMIAASARRVLRPGGAAVRRHAKAIGKPTAAQDVQAAVVRRFLGAPRKALTFTAFFDPANLQQDDDDFSKAIQAVQTKKTPKAVMKTAAISKKDRIVAPTAEAAKRQDLAKIVAIVRDGLAPGADVRRAMDGRIAAPPVPAERDLPDRFQVAPDFERAGFEMLFDIGRKFIMPGVGGLTEDRVFVADINQAFIEAFLLGANEELSREFLWREFPADPVGTWLRSFWRDDRDDILAVTDWRGGSIGSHHPGGGGASAAVILTGGLMRRFPETEIYLQRAEWRNGIREAVASEPAIEATFAVQLGKGVRVFGFPLDTETMRGIGDDPGYFVVLEEPETGPRFGLDAEDGRQVGKQPQMWRNLAWGHLAKTALSDLESVSHVPAQGKGSFAQFRAKSFDRNGPKLSWGQDAGMIARLTLQRPVRVQFHADAMLPGGVGDA